MTDAPKSNWHDAFPAPCITAPVIARDAVLPDLSSGTLLLVDVRRTDYEGGTIKGSINLPAQSFYMNRGVLLDLCKRAGVKQVAFYCGELKQCTWLRDQSVVCEWGDGLLATLAVIAYVTISH
jgi:arsenical-resistance protein 2